MAYIAQADITPQPVPLKDLIELTDDDGAGAVNSDVLTAVLDRASAKLDSYVAGRYKLPLNPNVQVKALAVSLAVFMLYDRRKRVPESVQAEHDRTIEFLMEAARGKVTLDQPAPNQQTAAQEVLTIDRSEEPQVFGDDNLEAFK